jgi:hypothetical protein
MKKIFTTFLFLASFFVGSSQELSISVRFAPYDDLLKMVKQYFRSDPYDGQFSWFLDHLVTDPQLINRSITKKTDSVLYSFKADYQRHNPFGFKTDRTEIRLTEKEFQPDDSLSSKDTLFVYQLLGYAFNGRDGLDAVKKEFSKFNRRFSKHFTIEPSELKKGTEVIGLLHDYFITGLPDSPLTVGWAKLDELQNVFMIILRLTVKENSAQLPLPIPFYNR